MSRNLSRNTKLVISTVGAGVAHTTSNSFEVPPLDGYSFTQDTGTQNIGVSEAGTSPIRGQKSFNTSLNPVDVSFKTYIKPFKNTNHDAVERILWGALVSNDALGTSALTRNGTKMTVDFSQSNVNQLDKLYLYFILDDVAYRIDDVVINTAEIDFSIDGIAGITWGGLGASITEDYEARDGWVAGTNYLQATSLNGSGKVGEFIENKLTTLTITDNNATGVAADEDVAVVSVAGTASRPAITVAAGTLAADNQYVGGSVKFTSGTQSGKSYVITKTDENATDPDVITILGPWVGTAPSAADEFDIFSEPEDHMGTEYVVPITGGTLTIDNGVTFLTPEELGVVNRPIDHFTGTRSITGSVTAYLNTGHINTAGLLNLISNDLGSVNNSFEFVLSIGGASAPKVVLTVGTAQLSIPTVVTEDVMSTEIRFTAQGSTGLEATDEMTIEYYSSQA